MMRLQTACKAQGSTGVILKSNYIKSSPLGKKTETCAHVIIQNKKKGARAHFNLHLNKPIQTRGPKSYSQTQLRAHEVLYY